MRLTTYLLILASFCSLSAVSAPSAAQSRSAGAVEAACYRNCVEIKRSGDRLLFFARNSQGEVFATEDLLLPRAARAVNPSLAAKFLPRNGQGVTRQSGLPVGSICASVTGVCTEHSSLTYETPSQYVIVSITYFFFNGELQDIDVDETRISKSKIK